MKSYLFIIFSSVQTFIWFYETSCLLERPNKTSHSKVPFFYYLPFELWLSFQAPSPPFKTLMNFHQYLLHQLLCDSPREDCFQWLYYIFQQTQKLSRVEGPERQDFSCVISIIIDGSETFQFLLFLTTNNSHSFQDEDTIAQWTWG